MESILLVVDELFIFMVFHRYLCSNIFSIYVLIGSLPVFFLKCILYIMLSCFCMSLDLRLTKLDILWQGWPVDKPDIVVSTPAALLNNIDPKTQRRLDFIRGVKYVVSFSSWNLS